MVRRTVFAGLAAAVLGIAVATAADDPIAARQAIMENVGGAAKIGGEMIKGERKFNADAVLLAMRTTNSSIIGFQELFPGGSETGGDTEASPKIWEDMAGSLEEAEGLRADTAAVIESPPQTLDEFKVAFAEVAQNCRGCHETFRIDND